eukprot:jgi/Botrbrau1/11654/Bobra.168_2s0011.1
MDEMRAMLDELMGQDRDGTGPKVKKKFTDSDICKYYLCGFCPYEEFLRTKHDVGPCPNVHDDACKADWEALEDNVRARYSYEADLKKYLERLMVDLKAKIKRNEERLSAVEKPILLPDDAARVAAIQEQIQEALVRSELLAEQGDIDGSAVAASQAETLKTQKDKIEEEGLKKSSGGTARYGQQEVCPLSGVIVNREESRMRDHKAGRNYRAWCLTHEKYKELEELFKKREEERSKRPPPPPPRERERERSRDYDRSVDRNRDRDRDRGPGSVPRAGVRQRL